jgi:dual specificity MAP kinase phosphatase
MTQLRSDSSSPKPKVEWEHFEQAQKPSTSALADQGEDQDDKMDIDEPEPDLVQQVEAEQAEIAAQVEAHRVWGMPKWGWEEERGEVRQGVRLIGAEEVSETIRLWGMSY